MIVEGIPDNKDLTYLGHATFRDQNRLFGIKRKDRRQHMYILGKSGTGKSALMFNMIIQNIHNGEGVCLVDPHGENVEAVLSAIPEHRIKDVIYFNPADISHNMGFNVLELVDPKYKHLVASGLMGIFTKIWANAWSSRMEYILNNTILALLDTPGTTLLGIPRMLVDKEYRQNIIANLKDPVVKAFWIHEYEAWQEKFRNEAIAPIQNKVGQFLSTSVIRNIVGQSQSTINIFDIMNEGKIFLVNVSKGRIGEDNSKLLGGMIVTKIQLAAMERVRIPEEERKDFYLYVDEFQNFVNDSFASILSEARKYRLSLTVAHQYIAQLVTKDGSSMRDSIFGNVGTMILFRAGADDAKFLEKELLPSFTPEDLINLPNFRIYLKLMIDGVTSRPFSAKTLSPLVKGGNKEIEDKVIEASRERYCRPRVEVEKEINEWSGASFQKEETAGGKYKIICATCGKETEVPFKPDPDRAVYCKDCVAKIKAGELKPIKLPKSKIVGSEEEFYKPLRDLGIEFKSENKKEERAEEDFVKKVEYKKEEKVKDFNGKKFNNFKDQKIKKTKGNNFDLKGLLNKVLKGEEKDLEKEGLVPIKEIDTKKEEITLDVLKSKKDTIKNDRSASEERVNALKNLISEKASAISTLDKTLEVGITLPKEEEKEEKSSIVSEKEIKIAEKVDSIKRTDSLYKDEEILKDTIKTEEKDEEENVYHSGTVPKKDFNSSGNYFTNLKNVKNDQTRFKEKKEDIIDPIKEVPEDVLRKILE